MWAFRIFFDSQNLKVFISFQKEESFHRIRVELLMILMVALVHATGFKYCKETLLRQFMHSLKKEDVLLPHAAEIPSYAKGQDDSKGDSRSSSVTKNEATTESGGHKRKQTETSRSDEEPAINNEDPSLSASRLEGNENEEECNPCIKVMVENTIKYFRILPPIIKEVTVTKLKCKHLAKCPFPQAL